MKIVVVMPFAKEFDPVYTTIKQAVKTVSSDWRCVRIDKEQGAGHILDKIERHIGNTTICIADVTGLNPNVMWEVGYASALHKPIIALSQSTANLPFDIYDLTVLPYQSDELDGLRDHLAGALRQTHRQLEEAANHHICAVAGSQQADPHHARNVFANSAAPYFGRGIHWYCGARFAMQRAILGVLLDHHERVSVIESSKHPLALVLQADPALAGRLQRHDVATLNADDELATPGRPATATLIAGFDATFTLYARRAERLFLLWDGHSVKTHEFQQWLAANGKTYLLARV